MLVSISGFSQNFTNQNYIQVIGTAEEEIIPNEIYMQIIIDEHDNKGKETLESLENKMIKKLKELNIDIDENLSVKDFSSNFQKYFLKQSDIFTSKEYQLILHKAKKVGEVFMALEDLGISNIKIEKIDHSDLKSFQKTARYNAVMDAKQKALEMAIPLGQQIGKAIYIHEFEIFTRQPLRREEPAAVFKLMETEPSSLPNIEFEKIKVEAKVEVYFELK